MRDLAQAAAGAARQWLGRSSAYQSGAKISTTEPEWEREQPHQLWDPTRRLIQSIRRYQYWRERGGVVGQVASRAWVIPHRFWSSVLAADIPINAQIGGGLILLHGQGVVLHADAQIGPNCLIAQGVTLGVNEKTGEAPHLGGRVDVGPGAKILGGVTIGAGAKIGANAVVLDDVPPGALAVGIPARVIEGKGYVLDDSGGSDER
ncbi:MAG: serine acetyltransferase [Myxococcota bacterium]